MKVRNILYQISEQQTTETIYGLIKEDYAILQEE